MSVHPYGYCNRCSSPIRCPGLSDSRCPVHGWLSTELYVVSQLQACESDFSEPKKIEASPSPRKGSRKKSKKVAPEVQQIELLGGVV